MLDFKAKMHQISFWLHGAPPQTLTGGAYSFSAPQTLVWSEFKGADTGGRRHAPLAGGLAIEV